MPAGLEFLSGYLPSIYRGIFLVGRLIIYGGIGFLLYWFVIKPYFLYKTKLFRYFTINKT